jgi:hypothetical protein
VDAGAIIGEKKAFLKIAIISLIIYFPHYLQIIIKIGSQ